MSPLPSRSALALAAALSSATALGAAQEGPSRWGKAWPSPDAEGSPFKAIPEGYDFVFWDDLDSRNSVKSFWLSKPDEWRFVKEDLDDGAGNVAKGVGPALFFKSSSTYKSRVRAPHSMALVRDVRVGGNFVLEVEMMQTGVETAHRDLCVFFGFEGPERFFYNHLGKVPDSTSSNVFDVDRADRVRIGEVSKCEIDWGRGAWHRVRLECEWDEFKGGRMRTFFDDMETPAFEKPLYREAAGFVGLGSFDDAGAFRNLHVWAREAQRPKGFTNPFGVEIVRRLWSDGPPSGELDILGAGSAKIWIAGKEYRVGMVRTVGGQVLTRERPGNAFFTGDGKAKRAQYQWVISDAGSLQAASGLVSLDEEIVLAGGWGVTAEPEAQPDFSSDFSLEPVWGLKLTVKPASESRSRYLARRYYRGAKLDDPQNPEGVWRWTTDIAAVLKERKDPRPVLLAITPKGSKFGAQLDGSLRADEGALSALKSAYRCLRVDPGVVAGRSVRWSAPSSIERRGAAHCVVLGPDGRVQRDFDDVPGILRFLAGLKPH